MATIRTNPVGSSDVPVKTILRLFPKINTLHVSKSTMLDDVEALPETITAIVVDKWDFHTSAEHPPSFARIVTETKYLVNNSGNPLNLALFPSLRSLGLTLFPNHLILPNHLLERVRVYTEIWEGEPLEQLFGDW